MPFWQTGYLAVAAFMAMASVGHAGPAPLDPRVVRPLNELVVRDPMEIARDQYLEKRLSADFSLDHEWNNEVLFGGSWVDSGEHDVESVSLSVTCIECWTKGIVTAKLTTEDIFKPIVRLDFDGVEAYVNLGVATSAGATYAINLFTSNSPVGLGFPGLSIGLVFYVDLIFSLSAKIDLTGGFYVKLADDAFLETDVFTGDITEHFFDGISTKSIPITVTAGSAKFKADLRLRVQCGAETELDLFGIGAGAVVGIYANIIEFVAIVDTTPTCALQTREWWDLNVGAYVHLDVVVDFKTIGAVPTVSTTLLNSPTFTQCWIEHSPGETGGAYITTATTISAPETLPAISQTLSFPAVGESRSILSTLSTVLLLSPTSTAVVTSTIIPSTSTSTFGYPISNSSSPTEGGLVTSTIYSTTEYTVTSCAASVVNCPVSWEKEIVVTKTVDAFTTVCPPGAVVTFPSSSTTAKAASATPGSDIPVAATVHVITEVVVLTPCASPLVETFVPPTTMASPTEHRVTVVIPPPTTLSVPIEINNYWTNATAHTSSTSVAMNTAGTGSLTQTTVGPSFTAGGALTAHGLARGSILAAVGVVGGLLVLL